MKREEKERKLGKVLDLEEKFLGVGVEIGPLGAVSRRSLVVSEEI